MRIYDNTAWSTARAEVIERDGSCVLAWLGECSGPLHVHHVSYDDPFNPERLVAVCEHHHGTADHLRRRARHWKRCPHKPGTHRYPGAREACEKHLNAA